MWTAHCYRCETRGKAARIASGADRPVVARRFSLFHELAADEVNPRVEKEQRFNEALNHVAEDVVARDMRAFVCDYGFQVMSGKRVDKIVRNDDNGMPQ